ncbi:hypothetical protein [Streptomyces canus]|uniref:hypothetical protein n=1 Tax=Streptomyces canus TaxID=58343 RepID=UPI003800198C
MLQGLVNACGPNSSWNSEEAVIALVESRPAWLEPVWSDEHRRLYRVWDGYRWCPPLRGSRARRGCALTADACARRAGSRG